MPSRSTRPPRWPAAIRDWYERDDALEVLARYSNADRPLPVDSFAEDHGHVIFLIENQGVCRWAFALDSADDPEIFVSQDNGRWQSCQCTFSGFVAAQIFDWADEWAEDARTLYSEAITPDTLDWMTKRFSLGPTARVWPWPSHRFYDERYRLRSVGEEWWVKAKTFADMDQLLEELAPFYDGEL